MADVTTKIRDQDVTLKDVTDPGYTPPTAGFVIELNTAAGRRFIRLGELQQLRDERSALIAQRAVQNGEISNFADLLAATRASRDAKTARIDEINLRVDEIVAWLTGEGDAT